MDINIEKSWKKVLAPCFDTENFEDLVTFIKEEYTNGTVYPPLDKIFEAFKLTPFDKVSVVILGQDPYHNPNQAHGLSFSVKNNSPPPSLKNIFKEIEADLKRPSKVIDGDLEHWAKQGVFLLNAILTVRKNSPTSHRGKGWESFTDCVIKTISDKKEGVVFLLWGAYAKEKQNLIDKDKHLILTAAHPSPYSANNGFFGSEHFSKTNEYLKEEIDW